MAARAGERRIPVILPVECGTCNALSSCAHVVTCTTASMVQAPLGMALCAADAQPVWMDAAYGHSCAGVEGVVRRRCEETLRVLRAPKPYISETLKP